MYEKKSFFSFIENGLYCKVTDQEKAANFCSNLYNNGINKNVIFIQDDKLWIDAKIATLLFQDFNCGIFAFIEKKPANLPMKVLEWMKREGEEYYLKGTVKDGYVLCPINTTFIKTVSRNLYKSIVSDHTMVIDIDGNQENIIFDKNIIHFKLMKVEDAKKIYQEIVRQNKQNYLKLLEWITHEL